MKKIICIVFAAVLAGFAISCQKVESVSEKTEAVQYTFNITVNDQVGFDSDASTKGSESQKSGWESGDKIFLFFKPTDGSLLTDTYATLTYNGSSWDGAVTGTTSLGEEGTLSAVYVYNLGDVTPEFSTDKWTIATGNTFYNCQTEVSYTVSGSNEISASLNLEAPDNFVRFSVYSASGALTCDKVKGWKDIAIGSDLAVSNVTCTGYMDGFTNSGDSNFKEYYGRIVSGASLKGVSCKFSVVKNGKVYEHSATPENAVRSFKMNTSATGDKAWTEAPGKLPGLFTISKGVDNEAGTADDVQVRFSQGNLVATIDATGAPTAWKFATNQYDCLGEGGANKTIGIDAGDIDLFGWSTDAASNNWGIHTKTSATDGFTTGNFKDWGTAIDSKGTWRTLTQGEWTYLFNTTSRMVNSKPCYSNAVSGVSIGGTTYKGVFIYPDNYNGNEVSSSMTWDQINAAGIVFLPAAGTRTGSILYSVNDLGKYWSSSKNEDLRACYLSFNSSKASVETGGLRYGGSSVRLVTDVE